MAKSVNKVTLVGNLGAEPDVRQLNCGRTVCNLSIATNEEWTDKESGEKKQDTEWHKVVMFGKLGEIGADLLKKGEKIYIEGRIKTRRWQDESGSEKTNKEIIAHNFVFLGKPTHYEEHKSPDVQPSGNANQPVIDDDIPF